MSLLYYRVLWADRRSAAGPLAGLGDPAVQEAGPGTRADQSAPQAVRPVAHGYTIATHVVIGHAMKKDSHSGDWLDRARRGWRGDYRAKRASEAPFGNTANEASIARRRGAWPGNERTTRCSGASHRAADR
jgi:hypothetical protein